MLPPPAGRARHRVSGRRCRDGGDGAGDALRLDRYRALPDAHSYRSGFCDRSCPGSACRRDRGGGQGDARGRNHRRGARGPDPGVRSALDRAGGDRPSRGERRSRRDRDGHLRPGPRAVPETRSSRSGRRRSTTGSASSATTARRRRPSSGCARCSTGIDGSCSPARAGGSASIRTSSARSRSCGPRRPTWRSPTRTTAGTREASDASRFAGRRPARLQRPAHRRHRREGGRGGLLDRPAPQQLHQPRLSADRQHGHRRSLAIPRRAARRRAAVPRAPGDQFHDHWVGLVALSTGRIAYVDRPLYDYVQHEGAALGHVAANVGVGRGVFVRRLLRGQWTGLVSGWRAAYFLAYCRLRLLAEVLMRCDDVMSRRSRRVLRRFTRSERSPVGFAWLAGRRAMLAREDRDPRRRAPAPAGNTVALPRQDPGRGPQAPDPAGQYDASFPARKQRRAKRLRASLGLHSADSQMASPIEADPNENDPGRWGHSLTNVAEILFPASTRPARNRSPRWARTPGTSRAS